MADSDTDPFDWPIDRVVYEVCQNPQPVWALNNNSPRVSNSAALEQALRGNHINGELLLVLVNEEILKSDLGIKSLGERYYIMRGIEYLRNLSQKYHLHQREQASNFQRAGPNIAGGFISPQVTYSNFSAYQFSPHPVLNGEVHSGHASPNKHSILELPPLLETPRIRPQFHVPTTPAQTGAALANAAMMLQQPIPQFDARTEQREKTPTLALPATPEAGVHRPVDAAGKVNGPGLSGNQPISTNGNAQLQTRLAGSEAGPIEPSNRTNSAKYTIVDGRKRLAPTFVSHITKAVVPNPSDTNTEEGSRYYLGQDSSGPESVFYPEFTSEDDNEEFSHVQSEQSTGRSLYVSRLMKHFYQQPIQQLPDSKARARIPYSRSLLKPSDPHYFTMFVPGLEPATHNLLHWPALASQSLSKHRGRNSGIPLAAPTSADAFEDSQERQYNADDYDYLLEKYPPKDEDEDVLALYGDSGDEGAYDLETWNEIDQDRREEELEKNKGAMSQAEVEATIDEGIKQIITEWHNTKLARTQLKGYRLWMKATRNHQRQLEMNNALYWIHRYDQTIKRMRDTITKDVWFKATEVKQQCKIFDEAVAQREEYQYFVTILSALNAPIRPDVETLRKKVRVPRTDLPDGEEVLDSDSDLGDFILNDDSSDAGSIPHDGAQFADAMEFLGPDDLTGALGEVSEASQEVEISPIPLAEAGIDGPRVEQDEEPSTVLVVEPESEDVQELPDMSDDSEDDIISSARKVGISRRSPETSRTGTQEKATESLLGSDEVDDSSESSQDSDLDALPALPNSKYRDLGRTLLSPVDLTRSSSPSAASPIAESQRESSSDYQVQTPELNPIPTTPSKRTLKLNPPKASSTPHTTPSPARTTLKIGPPSPPRLDDIQGIRGLDWKLLEERRDYRRVLAKVVYCLNGHEARKIQVHVQKFVEMNSNAPHASVQRQISDGKFLDQIRNGLLAINMETDFVEGVSPKQVNIQKIVRQLALLYASYANHTNLMDEDRISQPLLDQAFDDLPLMIKSFFDCLVLVLGYYCHATESKLHGTKRKASDDDDDEYKDMTKRDADILMLDTDEDHERSEDVQETAAPSSIKKRKRKVLQSQEALTQQRSDQLRVQEEERRKALADMKYAKMGISGENPGGHLVGTIDPQIFLHEHIGKRVKPHQVDGIQFMWREIISNPKQQGCLLAHTMGLGKTMQVISLLVTIALSARSEDIRIRDQVPERLRETKTLILCPPSLIDNWHDELIMWSPYPDVLGKVYKIQTQKRLVRLQQMSHWAKDGGVLIISYEMFRGLISNDGKKLSEEEHAQVQRDLLESPTIVVADEAHKMKNAGAKITQVASQFNTGSRIALTGSPLANNLEEYHTMIDWIAPKYLGSIVQFRAKYSEPISWGLYEDSTTSDKRTSLRKLITLGRDLGPKLNRADISAIEKEMPSKTEFFITVPLTPLQKKAYNVYVQALLEGNGTNAPANTRLWQWLHVLGLLCNHPLPFVNKLDERRYSLEQKGKPHKIKAMASTDESQGEALPTDVVLSDIGLSTAMIEQALRPFQKLDEENRLEDPGLSNRSLIVKQIVEESINIGDKVLIFSHTIPTLDYLEKMLDNIEGCIPCRIDGETKMSTRQDATKVFNKKDSAFNVFLISMKAGGLGLNLQGANRVIIYDFGFNPTWEDQAIGRAYRLGQKKSVYVYRFRAGGTFEDVTYNKAVFKTTLFSRVVDKKNYMSQAKKSLSSYLFDVKDVEQHPLEDSLGKDRAVLDRIVQRTKCIRNVELTETFQKEDLEKLSEEEVQLAVDEYEEQRMQRDDPAAYARKQATKIAQQMHLLSTNSSVHPPGPAIAQLQSTSSMLSVPALGQSVVNTVQQDTPIPAQGSLYFDPLQATLFSHRAPTAQHPPHPFHQELISDATSVYYPSPQLPRASSAGPEHVRQMDSSNDNPRPQTPNAQRNDEDLVDRQCRTQ
jgi:SNF2 family DNA or RNA helicase